MLKCEDVNLPTSSTFSGPLYGLAVPSVVTLCSFHARLPPCGISRAGFGLCWASPAFLFLSSFWDFHEVYISDLYYPTNAICFFHSFSQFLLLLLLFLLVISDLINSSFSWSSLLFSLYCFFSVQLLCSSVLGLEFVWFSFTVSNFVELFILFLYWFSNSV